MAMQIFEFRDRNAGEIFEYVERRNGRLKLDEKSKRNPVSDMRCFERPTEADVWSLSNLSIDLRSM